MGLHKGKSVSARTATKVWHKSVQRNKGVLLNTSTAQQVCSAQRRATQHKHSTTSVQCNKSTTRIALSLRSAATRRAFYLRKVSSMFSISSRNVASVANWRSIFLQLWRMVEWSRPPSSRPICDNDTSVNF